MAIMTVNGPIQKEKLGVTSPHEHALLDIRNQYVGARDDKSIGWNERVCKLNLEALMNDPYCRSDNLLLDDEEMCLREVMLAKKAGLNTFVDVTPSWIGRNPGYLRRLSNETRLNVIAGCGLYTQDTHPAWVKDVDEGYLADIMVRELCEGIDGTDIRAGIIGEIGTSAEIGDTEQKSLRASAAAHKETGAPIMIHLFPWKNNGLEVLNLLFGLGVAPDKICMCHTDMLLDQEYMRELLKSGVYVEFDNFGKVFGGMTPHGRFPTEEKRLSVLYNLIDEGYLSRLLASCDVCLKNLLTEFGGKGYAHILKGISDLIRCDRKDAQMIFDALLIKNPAEYLDNKKLF